MNRFGILILSSVLWAGLISPVIAQSESQEKAEALIDRFARDGVDRVQLDQLYRDCVLADGSVEPILSWLDGTATDLNEPRGQVCAEIQVHFASRLGDLRRASDTLNRLLKIRSVFDSRVDLRIWQAKLHDALGDVAKSKEIYQSLIQDDLSDEQQQAVRLRLALMGLIGDASSRTKSDAKPLIDLASKSEDVKFRNRAANVLAVQNQHAEAIKLFTIEGDGTERFRSASRVTEWAIRANNRDKAIESAWDAVESSELKRDRNYALALLVESYRMKEKKKGLEKLVEEFAERDRSDESMTAEMRSVWVSLLRELGRYDDAIKLFRSTADQASGFTVEMRRELLQMEGEAGNEDRMIQSYRDLIESEPDELVWRSGLTQVLLEKGQDDEAKKLWTDFVGSLDRGSMLLSSAQTLGEFGLDDLAKSTIDRMIQLRADHGQALLYWADLQQRRGNVEVAESVLDQIRTFADVGDDVRAELASAYERLGRQDKAIEVNEAIRAGRETVAEDLEMRLAWLYSEIGDEEKALQQWLELWRKITSIPRRRYVEDRLMTVASRLGTLADIAIELEEKLADGTADDREAGLLVRIYSRVNDSVAATEISEEYMAKSGRNEVEQLQEKGRIYQVCNDYWNYEKVIERLIEVDPEGKTEYLRQLALSMLERGKAQEARAVLMTLRDADDGKDTIGGEFEAGVLSLVGMNQEAAKAYRKGIARYPDRIESYLLLANLLKEMGQTDRAVGMFQYLAENAERDDLFTIAIDGLLNMEARGTRMQWARRITLERLAGREDKNYLYQLLSDLSAEVRDKPGQIRAMENSLAVAGTRRLSVLRECMELSSKIRSGVYYSSSSRGPTNKGNEPFFAFGRRLIGLGELMPPQVFLNLGQAFLADGDLESAKRTFSMARNLADPRSYQREVAEIFEKAGKLPEALVRYEKLLRTSPSDVPLMARVAKLNEQEGKDEIALRFYQRGLDLLISQTPLTTQEEAKATTYWNRDRDAYQTYSEQLLTGILVTLDDDEIDLLLDRQFSELQEDIADLNAAMDSGRNAEKLSDSPRIEKRTSNMRRMHFAFDRIEALEQMDLLLIRTFSDDSSLVTQLARQRIDRGRYDSVRRLLQLESLDEDQRKQLLTMLGDANSDSGTASLSPKEMWQRFLPVWMEGDTENARRILRRVDRSKGRMPGARPTYVIINGMAVLQNMGNASDIGSWMRLALSLGDEGLALQFARSRLKNASPYTVGGIKQTLDTYKSILPGEPFADLVRYAANVYKDDKKHLSDYLWLISNMREYLKEDIPDDEKLLEMVEDSDLSINYYFPFQLAMEAFPESIRAEAIAATIDGIDKKSRPRELTRIPFTLDMPVDEETAQVVLDCIKSGIEPAMQDNYLRYCTYYLPRTGQACKCPENADFAVAVLDLLLAENVQKREQTIPKMARYIKAVVLHQSGRTEEALELVLPQYDPAETITDSYVRYARDWAHRELVPVATERFVEHLDKNIKDGKPTTKQTDQRLTLYRQKGDDELLREAYEKAIKDHPKETKYASMYESWQRGKKRGITAIELAEINLAKLNEAEPKNETKIAAAQKSLANLWFSANHPVNGLRYWKIADDKDIERFSAEKQKQDQIEAKERQQPAQPNEAESKPQRKPEPAKQSNPQPATNKPAATKPPARRSGPPTPEKKYPANIVGVKNAIGDEDLDSAAQALRKIWRSFPPVVPSPYGYRTTTKRLNGLIWPADPKKPNEVKEADSSGAKSEQEKEAAKLAAKQQTRNRLRGGLSTFDPPERKPATKRQEAWKSLAKYPFAVSEMKRILRSSPSDNLANYSDVLMGLLESRRLKQGDDAVFRSLVEKIQDGQLGDVVLAELFAMLDEDHTRINDQNVAVVDTLLERLDLTNPTRASQLARLCAKIGQRERAKALYKHCALLSASGSPPFATLIGQVKEDFEKEELIQLAESMFELCSQDARSVTQILELRLECLDPETAAARSRDAFSGEQTAKDTYDMQRLVRGVEVFSRAGDDEIAGKCLSTVLLRHGKPRQMPANYYGYSTSSRNLLNVARSDLIRLFPGGDNRDFESQYLDYRAWLKTATRIAATHVNDESVDQVFLVEVLLVIALRQCELNEHEDAKATLDHVTFELLKEAIKHQSLAIDVIRLAGQFEKSLAVQKMIMDDGKLSHVRFGDYLRDAAAVRGQEHASKLFDELIALSMDEDLLDTAEEVAAGDDAFVAKVEERRREKKAAVEEHEKRIKDAADRKAKRQLWKSSVAKTKSTAVQP